MWTFAEFNDLGDPRIKQEINLGDFFSDDEVVEVSYDGTERPENLIGDYANRKRYSRNMDVDDVSVDDLTAEYLLDDENLPGDDYSHEDDDYEDVCCTDPDAGVIESHKAPDLYPHNNREVPKGRVINPKNYGKNKMAAVVFDKSGRRAMEVVEKGSTEMGGVEKVCLYKDEKGRVHFPGGRVKINPSWKKIEYYSRGVRVNLGLDAFPLVT